MELFLLLLTIPTVFSFCDGSATYTINFNATWSQVDFPDFPNSGHFSPIVGGSHASDLIIWQSGSLASNGIERMAEAGSTVPLLNEIHNSGMYYLATSTGQVLFSPGLETISITVDTDHPLVSFVAMIAPSPDWFVGISSESLCDDQTGKWKTGTTSYELFAYDAGTDDGLDFFSPDSESNPHVPISLITDTALFPVALGSFDFINTMIAGGTGDPHFRGFHGEFLDIVHDSVASNMFCDLFCNQDVSISTFFGETPDGLLYMTSLYVQIGENQVLINVHDGVELNGLKMDTVSSRVLGENQVLAVKTNDVRVKLPDLIMTVRTLPYEFDDGRLYLDLEISLLSTQVVASGLLGRTAARHVSNDEFTTYLQFLRKPDEDPFKCSSF